MYKQFKIKTSNIEVLFRYYSSVYIAANSGFYFNNHYANKFVST